MPFVTLPEIPPLALQREFFVDDARLEVTSLDIPPHGAFIVAGCSNGMVLLFDLTESVPQRNGILLAQIRAKGMHTNLRLTVKISEDSRMCFAGVMKGSSEMLAIDLSTYLVNWHTISRELSNSAKGKKVNSTMNIIPAAEILNHYYFETFICNDPKLRGFRAAACLTSAFQLAPSTPVEGENTSDSKAVAVQTTPDTARKYLLACGMGIKNVHVWELCIKEAVPVIDGVVMKRDEWSCIYDVASNGMTITHLGFRSDGKELLTKSFGVNIRVWDISKYATEPNGKPSYEDIANTHDVKCLLENTTFTYGGTYEFAMVKVDKHTPKEANRNAFELPDKLFQPSPEDEVAFAAGLRRRRTNREVQDVIGTQDGVHVLVLCGDGGVMYYRRPTTVVDSNDSVILPSLPVDPSSDSNAVEAVSPSSNNSTAGNAVSSSSDLGRLQEIVSIQREAERDQAWTLKRIGPTGQVVLLRAAQCSTKEGGSVGLVSISNLSSLLTKEQYSAPIEPSTTWHSNNMFYQSRILPVPVIVEEPDISLKRELLEGGEGTTQSAKKRKTATGTVPGSAVKTTSSSATATATATTPAVSVIRKPPRVVNKDRDRDNVSSHVLNSPAPRNNVQALFAEAAKTIKPASTSALSNANPSPTGGKKEFTYQVLVPEDKEWRPLTLGPLPRVKRTVVSDLVLPKATPIPAMSSPEDTCKRQFQDSMTLIVRQWKDHVLQYPFPDRVVSSPLSGTSNRMTTLQQIGHILKEQLHTRTLMLQDIEQLVRSQTDKWTTGYVDVMVHENKAVSQEQAEHVRKLFKALEVKYQQVVEEMLSRQRMEMKGSGAMDRITSGQNFAGEALPEGQVQYRYQPMFGLVQELSRSIATLFVQ